MKNRVHDWKRIVIIEYWGSRRSVFRPGNIWIIMTKLEIGIIIKRWWGLSRRRSAYRKDKDRIAGL